MKRIVVLAGATLALVASCGARADLAADEAASSSASTGGAGGAAPGLPLQAELRDVQVFINIEGSAVLLISGELVLDNSGGVIARQADVVAQSVFLFQDDVGQTYEGPEPAGPISVPAGQVLSVPFASSLDVTDQPNIDIFCGNGAFTLADVDLRLEVVDEETLYLSDTTGDEVGCACC